MYDLEPKLKEIDEVIEKGPYKADWNSLGKFQVPDWFYGAKFGIFIHWGLYSVPANSNEWYSRNMYIKGMPAYEHHVKTYGTQDKFGYKDFIPMLTAEKFDPKEWVTLFKYSGAKYVFPVAEHHDGFQMYDSEISEWNAKNMGPKRDILGELKAEIENQGLIFCTSSHRAEHWWFMGHGKEFESDVKEPLVRGDFYWPSIDKEPDPEDLYSQPYPSKEFLDDWLVRTAEIIDKYKPRLLYFDWWIQHQAFKDHLKKLVAYYYNRGLEWETPVAICYKHDALSFGTGIVEIERGAFADARAFKWETDTAVARNSWCYTDTLDYKSSAEIIYTLVDVVSKNGNLLLNVGPKADGTIPDGDKKILKDLANWIGVNGEAIYDSHVWRKIKEGPTEDVDGQFQEANAKTYTSKDFRFTCGNGAIYAIALKYPEDGKVCITSFRESGDQNKPEFHGIIKKVSILGDGENLDFVITANGLEFTKKFEDKGLPVVIKIETE